MPDESVQLARGVAIRWSFRFSAFLLHYPREVHDLEPVVMVLESHGKSELYGVSEKLKVTCCSFDRCQSVPTVAGYCQTRKNAPYPLTSLTKLRISPNNCLQYFFSRLPPLRAPDD